MSKLLEVKNLSTYFYMDQGIVKAVEGVGFSLDRGETLGIVGESGSGKSVTALSILRLVPKLRGRIVSGEIVFEGRDLLKVKEAEMRAIRGNRIAMIFQDPMTSLNPVHTVGAQIVEAIVQHKRVSRADAWGLAIEALESVGLPHARERAVDYPHQFSGGMRQRAMIAMAMSCGPDLLIADEPTTALDVTIQAQILELMKKVQEELNSGLIMITHDLGVVAEVSDRVLVMYAGRPVEYSDVESVFYEPMHPYTLALTECMPRTDLDMERLCPISGSPPSLIYLPTGCAFNPRCAFAEPACREEIPQMHEVKPGHWVSCLVAARGEGLKAKVTA